MSAALLGTEDLNGFTKRTTDDSKSPLPCTPDEPALSETYPAEQHGEAAFTSSSGKASVDESVYVYSDETDAEKFVAAGEKGFDCRIAKLGDESAKIVPVPSGPTATGIDVVKRWDLLFSDKTLGTAYLVRKGAIIIGLTFEATQAGASEIDPMKTLITALAKV